MFTTKLSASRTGILIFNLEVKLSGLCSQNRSLNDLYSIFLSTDYCDKETLVSRPTGVWLIRWYSSPHCPWSITNYQSGISFQELLVKKWLLAESGGKRSPLWHGCKSFKIQWAVRLNYCPKLIDINLNRRMLVTTECHNDIPGKSMSVGKKEKGPALVSKHPDKLQNKTINKINRNKTVHQFLLPSQSDQTVKKEKH